MTFQPPTIVISTPTIGFSTDHYSRFNRPLGVFTAHYWRFNRPLLAFQTPTIGVLTAHWAFETPTFFGANFGLDPASEPGPNSKMQAPEPENNLTL